MPPHLSVLPSPCTFGSPNLPTVLNVGQSGCASGGAGSNTFGISASFTQGRPDEQRTCFTVTGYNDPVTSWVPVLNHAGEVHTCTFDPSPGSLMCSDMPVSAFKDGTHTISYKAASGYTPFDPVSFVVVSPTPTVAGLSAPTEVHSTITQTLTSTRKVVEEHIVEVTALCPTVIAGVGGVTNVPLGSTTLTSTAATLHLAASIPPAPTFIIPVISATELPISFFTKSVVTTTAVEHTTSTIVHLSTPPPTTTTATTKVEVSLYRPSVVTVTPSLKVVFETSFFTTTAQPTKEVPSVSIITPTIIMPTYSAVTPTIVIPSELLNPFSIYPPPSISVVTPQIVTANVVTPTIIMPTITITSIPPTQTVTVVSATVITPNIVTPTVIMPTVTTIDKAPISSLQSVISSLSAANQASDSTISAHIANALAPLPSLAAAVSSLAAHETLVDNPRITSLASAVTSLVMAANANSRSGAVVMSSIVSAASVQLTSNAAAISSLASVNSAQSHSDIAIVSALASADASFKADGSSILASVSAAAKAQSTSQAQAAASFAQAVSSLQNAVSAVSASIKSIESAGPTIVVIPSKTTATVSFTASTTVVVPTPVTSIISVPHVTTATVVLTTSASILAPTVTTATVSFTTSTSVLVPTTFTFISSEPFVTTRTAVITTLVSDLVSTVVTKTVSFTTSATVVVPTVITSIVSVPEPTTATIIVTAPSTVLATTVLTAPTTVLVPTSVTATVSFTTSAIVSVTIKETETTSISASCAKCEGSTAPATVSTQQSLVTLTTVLSTDPPPTSSTATVVVVQPTSQAVIPPPSSTGSAVTITLGSTTLEIPVVPSSLVSPQVTTVASSSVAVETETVLVPSTTTVTQPSSKTTSSAPAIVMVNTTTTVVVATSPISSSVASSAQGTVTAVTVETTTTLNLPGGTSSTVSTTASAPPVVATGDVACPDNDGEGIIANTGALFLLECNVDRTDNDITGIDNPQYVNAGDIKTCVDICGITATCVDVSLSGSACYLKNGLGSVNSAQGIIGARQIAAAPVLSTSTADDSSATDASADVVEDVVQTAGYKAKTLPKGSMADTSSAASAYRSGTFSIPTTTGAAVVDTAPKALQQTGKFVKCTNPKSFVTIRPAPRKSIATVGQFITATSGPKSGQVVDVEGHIWSWNVYCSNFPEKCSHDWSYAVGPNPRFNQGHRKPPHRLARRDCQDGGDCPPVSPVVATFVTTIPLGGAPAAPSSVPVGVPLSQFAPQGGIKIVPHLVYETVFTTITEVQMTTKTTTVCPGNSPPIVNIPTDNPTLTVGEAGPGLTITKSWNNVVVMPATVMSSALVSVYNPGTVPSPVPKSVYDSVYKSLVMERISAASA